MSDRDLKPNYYDDIDCDAVLGGESLDIALKRKLREMRAKKMEWWYNWLVTGIVFLFVNWRVNTVWAVFAAVIVSLILEKAEVITILSSPTYAMNPTCSFASTSTSTSNSTLNSSSSSSSSSK